MKKLIISIDFDDFPEDWVHDIQYRFNEIVSEELYHYADDYPDAKVSISWEAPK